LTDDGTLYASGEGLGKCGAKDAEEFTAHDEKIVMFGTSDEVFYSGYFILLLECNFPKTISAKALGRRKECR
jgi:hypothetical protein